jgi:hypothetical protein
MMEKDKVKFGCLCITAFPIEWEVTEADLGHGYYLEKPLAEVDLSTWRDPLGRWEVEELSKADLWIWSVRQSNALDVADAENQEIAKEMYWFWASYLLHHPPITHGAWTLTGKLVGGTPDVRTMGKRDPLFNQGIGRPPKMTVAKLKEVASLAPRIGHAIKSGALTGRLERGWLAFLEAMKTKDLDQTILHFERALEAIAHPTDAKQFVSRFARVVRDLEHPKQDSSSLLAEIYDVRSGLAHAEAIETVFPQKSREEAARRGRELRAALLHIVSASYREIFASDNLIALYSSEGIGDHWDKVVARKRPPPFTVTLEPTVWREQTPQDGR